jgi:ubiquinone biosynthesis protein
MVGQVDEATKEGLLYLLLAIANHDMDRVLDQLVALGVMGNPVQLDKLRHDLSRLLALYWGLPLEEIDIARVLEESMATARRHRLQVPTSLVLLAKTMAMNEGLARSLEPRFSTTELLKPYVMRLAVENYLPRHWKRRVLPALMDISRLAVTVPRRTERLLTQAERGNLSLNMRIQEIDAILDRINAMVNRLVLGMLATGFVVGIALLLQIYYTAGLRSLIGVFLGIGLALATGLGIWLGFNILRGSRH